MKRPIDARVKAIAVTATLGIATAIGSYNYFTNSYVPTLLTLVGTLCTIIVEQMYFASKLATDLTTFIENRLPRAQVSQQTRSEMYKTATELVTKAKTRLLIIQRTPPNIFSTTGSQAVIEKEGKFWEQVKTKMDESKKGHLGMVYTFSIHDQKFKQKLNDLIDSTSKSEVLRKVDEFLSGATVDNLNIFSLGMGYHTNPLLISDDMISIWISESDTGSESTLLTIRITDENEAKKLFDRYVSLGQSFDKNRCIAELSKLLNI